MHGQKNIEKCNAVVMPHEDTDVFVSFVTV